MVAVVEAGGGQAAKRRRSEATDGKGRPPPQPVRAVRKQQQPTPDHPPYRWMIGEAIDELSEHGGSEEDSISAFIRARHPGVPPAHDRLLRHYLDKHVDEGFFVCTAAGRYLHSSEENTVEERSVEQITGGSSEEACVGPPVAEAKRGRGRPRKDGSSPAGKKDRAPSHTPSRALVVLTDDEDSVLTSRVPAAEDSVPASLVAVPDKDRSHAASSTPKRRRLCKLGMATATTDNSGKALVAAKKDGSEVPYTMDKEHEAPRELALVIIDDDPATTSIRDKACSEIPPTTPGEGDQPLELALVTTTEPQACVGPPVAEAKRGRGRPRKDGSSPAGKKDRAPSHTPRHGRRRALVVLTDDEDSVLTSRVPAAEDSVPASLVAVPDKDRSHAASSTPKRRRLCKLGMATATTDNSGKALVAAKKDGSEVPYTMDKEHEAPRELALVIIGDDPATTSIMDKACSEIPPTTPGEGDQPLELALVTTTDVSVLPAPTPATNKDSETINRALVIKNDSTCTISTAPEPSSQACELAPMVADDIPVPVFAADNDGVEEAPSATYNRVHQPRGSASTATKKAGSKALSGTPNGCRRRCKLAKVESPSDRSALTPVAGKEAACKVSFVLRSALTPVAGKKAAGKVSFASPKQSPVTGCSTPSVADQDSVEARKLYPVTANEIPDDPAFCLLALPCLMPAAAKG